MGTINYTITSGVLPITVNLKLNGYTIMTNNHVSFGTYSFTNVTAASYTMQFVDSQGCNRTETIGICGSCAAGFTPVVGGCLYLDRKPATYSGSMYNLMGFSYNTYSINGILLFSNYNSDGTGTYQAKSSSYWTNPGDLSSGPLNRSAVWTTSIVDNQDIAFQHCITIAVEKTYYVGIGCDNYGFIKLNGTNLITQNISALRSMLGSADDRVPFLYWYIYPIILKVGLNILEVGGHNNPGTAAAAVGVEIYDNTMNDILNATSDANLNILFRSKSKVGTNCWYEYSPSGTHGYTCPSGYALDTCDGTPDCVKRYEYTCGGVAPVLPTTTTTTLVPITTTTTLAPITTTTTATIPTVITTIVTSITSTSAISGGNVTSDGGKSVTSRGVCWSTTSNPTISNFKTVNGTGVGIFTSNIIGLVGGTYYFVRAYATNSIGTAYGAEQRFLATDVATPGFGKLYNWYAANDTRNIANTGWHVPTKIEFDNLITAVGTSSGYKLKEIGTSHWVTANGTNAYSFKAVGSGIRDSSQNGYIKQWAEYWTKSTIIPVSQSVPANQWVMVIQDTNPTAYTGINVPFYRGVSLRLVKDTPGAGTYTGNDGKVYQTATIGGVTWLAENLRETQYRDHSVLPEVQTDLQWNALTSGAYCWYNNNPAYE